MSSLIERVASAFNRHGSFTARPVENDLAVELRDVDSGAYLALVWLPSGGDWAWYKQTSNDGFRSLPKATTVEEVVRAVATSVLDEEPKR